MKKEEIIKERLKEKHKALLQCRVDKTKDDYECFEWDLTAIIIHDLFNELQSIEPEEKEIKQCPFCGSENLFDFWMHHYKCKDCEEKFDV